MLSPTKAQERTEQPVGADAARPFARLAGLSPRTLGRLAARARDGDPQAARQLLLRVGAEVGNAGAAAVASPPVPQPCNLTPTTVVPAAGDLTDDQALAATYTLPSYVQNGNGGWNLNTDCRRREFMRWAREWFGTYQGAIDHFNAIELASVPGTVYVHRDAKARLEAVAAELGSAMPSSDVAFSFRASFSGAHPSQMSMHTLGYAIDYDPVGMPRMGRTEMALLIELMTGGTANANVLDYARRRAAIRRMGDRTAAGTNATQGDSTAATVASQISSEFNRLSTASAAFQNVLGAQARTDFLELRTRYFEASAADRPALLAQVPTLLAPIFSAIATAEAAPGLTPQRRALLTSLRAQLASPAFLFGAREQPRAPRVARGQPPAPTPRPRTKHTHDGPSLAQLFEAGWISQGTGGEHWGLPFLESMVRHGFECGFVWGGATQDSMHFELVVPRPYTPPAAPQSSATAHH